MKKLLIIFIFAVIGLAAGYFLGNIFPFKNDIEEDTSSNSEVSNIPENKGRLIVTIKNADNEAIIGIEVDVAVQPGPPEEWGVKEADTEGVVEYDLEPGMYYVFFNMNRFPGEYSIQPEKKVTITAGEQEEMVFILERK